MNTANRRRILKIAVAAAAVIIVAVLAVLAVQRYLYLGELRAEMDELVADTAIYMERGDTDLALTAAADARELALTLRDSEAVETIDAYTVLANTIIRADMHYHDGSYQSALSAYRAALVYASKIDGYDTRYIDAMMAYAEGYIDFFDMMRRADSLAGEGEFEAAQEMYSTAAWQAFILSFSDGQEQAEQGVQFMEEQIALARWRAEMQEEAEEHMEQGNLLLQGEQYAAAIEEFLSAAEIYEQIDDTQGSDYASEHIANAMVLQAEAEAKADAEMGASSGGAADGTAAGGGGSSANANTIFDQNRSIGFDLSTMIDRQDAGAASQVKMGSAGGRNEGWYNGCGWIATYNLLIELGSPRHPADIVRYFETSGGTVMDGEFGTYPHAIEDYLISLGFDARHTLFPGAQLSIDDEIKNAGAGILAYLHTSAAHYVMIEYRESDSRFVVYNDSLARAHSSNLGYSNLSPTGAVIDSVEIWLAQTPQILLTFSLITAVG